MEINRFSYLAVASLLLAVPTHANAEDNRRPAEMVTAPAPSDQATTASLSPQENLRAWVKGIKPAAGPGIKEEKERGHYSSNTVYRQFKE